MDAQATTMAAPPAAPPAPAADLRPAADAAAVARDTTPEIALPIPASQRQVGAVNASRMGEPVPAAARVDPTERVLKPFGVAMLPEGPSDRAMPAEG